MLPGLTMPAFSPATSARVGPRNSTWSRPTLVTTATSASTTLVASQRPPSPTSKIATSTGRSANHSMAAAVRISNQVRRESPSRGSIPARVDSTSASSASLMGSPSALSRSLMASRCGLVNVPTRRPLAVSREVRQRAVDVLPLVPVTWITGAAASG